MISFYDWTSNSTKIENLCKIFQIFYKIFAVFLTFSRSSSKHWRILTSSVFKSQIPFFELSTWKKCWVYKIKEAVSKRKRFSKSTSRRMLVFLVCHKILLQIEIQCRNTKTKLKLRKIYKCKQAEFSRDDVFPLIATLFPFIFKTWSNAFSL